MAPPNFLEHSHFVLEKWYPKQNSAIRLKCIILAPHKFLGYATGEYKG